MYQKLGRTFWRKRLFLFLFPAGFLLSGPLAYGQSKAYDSLERRLCSGWNTWSYGSMLTQVLLPKGLALKVNFRNAEIGTPYDPNYFLENITVDKSGIVRPVAHTFDGSYTELVIDNWYGNSIRIQSASAGEDVIMLITPLRHSKSTRYYVELQTGMMWNRSGTVERAGETIVASFPDKQYVIRATKPTAGASQPYTSPYLSCIADTCVGFYTGAEKKLEDITAIIATAKNHYEQYALKYGGLAEAFKGIQSVLGWNTLYDADMDRVITPVTRGWNEAWQGFVLFEWDTYFAAFLFALDNKDLAYSNAIAVTRGIGKAGAVGFTQMPGGKVSDQSQPPVGSMICWKIYEKYREKWFLQEVYNGLLSWNRWWIANRVNKGYLTWGAPWKNAAAKDLVLESGLDNSPMYENISVQQVGGNSLMNLADVGLNSLYAADCEYLAKISRELGKRADEEELVGRSVSFKAGTGQLWDDTAGIYLNRYLDTGTNSRRLSPTLFYPLIAAIPSERQAHRMLAGHYFNPREFYGDYIIPSIARSDKSFNNDYWRGAIWGPMNFLVYLGLGNYDKKAARQLADRSYDLFLKSWNEHHYVFENINSVKGVAGKDDNKLNCDPYYHWGALMGIMKFMEEGKFQPARSEEPGSWSLLLHRPGEPGTKIAVLPRDWSKPFSCQKDVGSVHILFALKPGKGYTAFTATATTHDTASVYFSLQCSYPGAAVYNFDGEVKSPEIFRQSPHDVNAWITDKIAKQAVPVVAVRSDTGFIVAVSSSPAYYKNFTSQAFYPERGIVALRSGDDGGTPGISPESGQRDTAAYNKDKTQVMSPGKILSYYQPIRDGKSHVFEGLLFATGTHTLRGLRQAINQKAAACFSGGRYRDYFGSLAFTTAYMNTRTNETGKSPHWVVPSVEYANTQYCRDGFWISTMLPAGISGECLANELKEVNTYAEYPLMTILWAYRARKEKISVDLAKVQAYVDSVESRARNGYFYSYTEKDGRQDFQYWGDIIAFDKDDVITYNQGLFALALEAAREMGLRVRTDPALALANYRGLFNIRGGFFPISKKKSDITGPDPVVADLLSMLYFGHPLLPDTLVRQHYRTIEDHLKTAYGFKVIAQPNGSYLTSGQYDVSGYRSQANRGTMPDGQYFRGGSFFLYDNLFLIDAWLHGVKRAESELVARVSLDFSLGGTTFECLNTITGEPWKPNMGWNIAIYSFWRKLVDEGRATDRLFKYIDSIAVEK